MLMENGADRLAGHEVATNLRPVKNVPSVKFSKAKCSKMSHGCTNMEHHPA